MYLDILCATKNFKSIYKNVSVISVLRGPAYFLQVRYVFSMFSLHILVVWNKPYRKWYFGIFSCELTETPDSHVSKPGKLVSTPEKISYLHRLPLNRVESQCFRNINWLASTKRCDIQNILISTSCAPYFYELNPSVNDIMHFYEKKRFLFNLIIWNRH